MVDLALRHLKEINEKNGIVFGDMILEELGERVRECCQKLTEQSGCQITAMRLDGDEVVIWLEGQSGKQAKGFIRELLRRIHAAFDGELFDITLRAGLVCAGRQQDTEQLIRMAVLAQNSEGFRSQEGYIFFEDISEKEKRNLPPLQGREINSLNYGEEVHLVSIALNLFGRGADFPAQLKLILGKIGKTYQASDILVSMLHSDFNTNYLEYQWHRDGKASENSV